MEQQPKKLKFTRREMILGAAAFSAGIFSALGGAALIEGIKKASEPRPDIGKSQSNLVVEWVPNTVSRWKPQIEKWSYDYNVDPNLLAIIMAIESGGDPNADSGVATGLMQITDDRAKDIASKFLTSPRTDYDLKNPDMSIEFGAANVRHLINQFGDLDQGPSWGKTVSLVAAGYYGGEGAAITYLDKGLKGIEDQGTYNYIRYVTTMWRERHDNRSFAYRFWYDQGNGQALVRNAEKYILP
jgi:soluble lytic murein transglycosylase-like protein